MLLASIVMATACAQTQGTNNETSVCEELIKEEASDSIAADSVSTVFEKANKGDVKAQLTVGRWYYTGYDSIEKDYDKALKYWALAAKQGSAQAIAAMAMCYQLGHGAKKDSTMAVGLYKKAIDKGDKKVVPTLEKMAETKEQLFAARLLKECYQKGLGVEKNVEKQAYYLEKLAKNGDIDAQYELALLYLNSKKAEKAVKWFKQASNEGHVGATYYAGWLYFKGEGVKQDKEEAIKLLKMAADKDFVMAQYRLGQIFYEGDGTTKDYDKAAEYITKAAYKNNTEAKWMLAICYLEGNGVKQDFFFAAQWMAEAANSHKKEIKQIVEDTKHAEFADYINGLRLYYIAKDYESAIKYFKKVQKAKYIEGNTMIGVCLANKDYAKRDIKKAVKYLEVAAKESPAASYYLAAIYESGTGVDADKDKAIQLLQSAAENGMAYAQCKLANKYMKGDGVNKDLTKAAQLYLKAEDQNYLTIEAAKNLAECYRQQINILPDLDKAEDRIKALNNLKENNNLFNLLAKAQ